MKPRIWVFMAAFLATSAVASASAQAQDECALFDRIINSGLDRQNPFAAVAGVTLPNADSCDVDLGDRHTATVTFECGWNEDNHAKLEKLEDEEGELFDDYIDHDGGDDYWDEAEDLIDEANYWIRTYNAAIQEFPRPNNQQLALMNEWKRKARKYERRAHDAEQEAIALDQEKEQIEARYDAKQAELEQFETELEKLVKRQAGALYTGIYACFSSGAIRNASAYQVDSQNMSWEAESGCQLRIDSYEGPRLIVDCPNPDYQSE